LPPKKPIPIRKSRKQRDFRAEAFNRLKQGYEASHEGETFDAEGEPVITPILKAAEGGIPRLLEALRAHDDDDARSFIERYDSLTATDRKHLSLEEIAVASGIGSLRLAEISLSASILHGQLTSKLILASAMPSIVQTSVKWAKTKRGLADREMMLKAGGVLPVPKGAQIAIQNNVAGETKETESEPMYLDPGQRLRMIHEAVEQRRLPAPPSEPISIDGRLSHLQDRTAEILVESDDVL
jgi:hypothetical protein